MFLLVFVTLMISIIGLYAQVLSLQTTKIYNAQVGLMQTMMTWHGAATALGRANVASITSTTGCSLTAAPSGTTPVLISACIASGTPLTVSSSVLPTGYNIPSYSFYSIAYTDGTNPYVVTFAHDTNSATHADPTKDLILPAWGGGEIGYSLDALMGQFARSAPPGLTYGSVTTSGVLTVRVNNPGAPILGTSRNLSYTVPATIPVGSLAIISVAK